MLICDPLIEAVPCNNKDKHMTVIAVHMLFLN